MTDPLVSVILIGYNDATRIVRALESLRNQTLRSIEIIVVDDASTDATSDIVEAVAAGDPRIRLIRRTENSGGCSAPRNDGIAHASAPWVMFCDSDDEYEPHACANLLAAAEEWDADVVCGMAVRHDVSKNRDKPWRPEVHSHDRWVQSLEDEPGLLYDTISVNKIYRRALLDEYNITFPPGLLFEDQVFTLECYLRARRIGIVQSIVYIWNVDRTTEELSITQGRMQERNVLDRVEINKRMDSLLEGSSDELRLAKAIKFLRHEGYLYLWAIGENPRPAAAHTTAHVFGEYVRTVDPRAFDYVRPALRVALYGLLINDLGLLRSAMRWERWASVVDTTLVRAGDKTLWTEPGDRSVLGRDEDYWLDVSKLHLLDMPFSTRRYLHELTSLEVHRSRVSVTVQTTDFASDLDDSTRAQLVWTDKAGRDIASLQLSRRNIDPEGRLVWSADGLPDVHITRPLMRPDRGTVNVRLTQAGLVNTTAIRSVDVAPSSVFIPFRSVAFADRPAGATLLTGERASVVWRPGGLSRGPIAWGRRFKNAARRRLRSSRDADANPQPVRQDFDLPTDRPIVAYLPAPSERGQQTWPLDLSEWDQAMVDTCYLLAGGDVRDPIPTRLWGSVRDVRRHSLGDVLGSAGLLITDDPALFDTGIPTIIYRPDAGARRYLLPPIPVGYSVIETLPELVADVSAVLARGRDFTSGDRT